MQEQKHVIDITQDMDMGMIMRKELDIYKYQSRSKSSSTSQDLKAKNFKVLLTRSTCPFGTQDSGEPSQIFTTLRKNSSDIQDAEHDELPAIMPTTIKLQ
ncbi:MAG: hypothetical protein EZS28_004345 [Streblomastix strix]|uniref:Uncharacterized protein n=1 Tax=Streblomastix strix TaxID=222440 RepID=A0A5J4WZ54_9EUKA|nr:MAG: hypothetical protein EZS28_004345 [Streblomastix strix]